jgi:hypothetical protein
MNDACPRRFFKNLKLDLKTQTSNLSLHHRKGETQSTSANRIGQVTVKNCSLDTAYITGILKRGKVCPELALGLETNVTYQNVTLDILADQLLSVPPDSEFDVTTTMSFEPAVPFDWEHAKLKRPSKLMLF